MFPRTSVVIEHEGRRPFVSDPAIATLYNTGQRYERRAISPDGDRCDWFAVSSDVLRDAVRPLDPSAADDASHVIRHEHARVDSSLYLEQRRLFDSVRTGRCQDPIEVEERVLALLGRVLQAAYAPGSLAGPSNNRRATRQRALAVDDARTFVGPRVTSRLSLSDIAVAAGCSPFHLCRAFRAVMGSTVHEYLTALRLRVALDRMDRVSDLTEVALSCGFSSHSHFSAAFKRAFRVTPSQVLRARS